ncbi:MAG: S41 family peptidase, partial [Bacteroidales bacterium]|nr:S41 family peptidase [Bacteroidales bacterium]
MRKYFRIAVLAGAVWISLLPVSAQYDLDPANKFARALDWIQRYYVDSVNTSKLVEDAIVGMLKDLDPHTVYMNRDEVRQMNEPLQGNFEGIGVSFYLLEDTILVIKPVPEGPSDKVGVKAGDKIITINGENVAGIGLTNDGVFERLRGPRGTTVTVGIKRQGEPELLQFKIQRDKIPIFSLDAAYMISPGVGYIKINRFAATTSREFTEAFRTLKSKGMTRLILDLSQNVGGYLEEAIRLADFFLSKNKLILYTHGLKSPRQDFIATSYGEFEKGDLVIVIDENSASASEIVAGAIQDWDRGLIVGRRSFGKGLVQRPVPLPDGSLIRLTVARYYTPTGRSIQKPYKDGIDAYEQDLIKRYQHG